MAEQAAADPAAQNPEGHAGGHDPGNMADPPRLHALGDVGGQQIGRDGEKTENGRGGDKQREAAGQRHCQHGKKLPGNKYGDESAVVEAVAERQQQQDAQRQRDLVERRSQPDGCATDTEFLGNRCDQRVDIIAVGHHRRRRQGEQEEPQFADAGGTAAGGGCGAVHWHSRLRDIDQGGNQNSGFTDYQ